MYFLKKVFSIFITICFVGCSLSPNELKTAERLMEISPDSALHILKRIKRMELVKSSDKALYALLMSQALDKNDIKVESDSLISIATDYFDESDPIRAGYAWFYMARCANNRGNADIQADALLKAQEFAEMVGDNKLKGLVYGEKANLYTKQNETDSLLIYRKLSLHIFNKINDKYNSIITLLNIGHIYLNSHQLDSALAYYRAADKLSQSVSDILLTSTVDRSLSMVYFQRADYKTALRYLNSTPLTDISVYDSNIYYLKAMIFLQINELDSANIYLSRVKQPSELTPDYYHLWLTLYEKKGELNKALHYATRIIETKDSLYQRKLSVSFAGLEKKYKYQSLQVSNQQLTIKDKQKSIILLFILFLSSIGITSVLIWRNRAKSHRLKVQEQLLEHEINLVEKEKVNTQLLERQVKMQNILLLNVEQYRKHSLKRPSSANRRDSVISPILNITFHEELIACMDIEYNNISKRLISRFPELTERDILICCLLLANFDTGMIATILDVKIESVTKHRYRLRTKLGMPNSDNLVEFLRTF